MANLGGRPTAALVLEPDEREDLERPGGRAAGGRGVGDWGGRPTAALVLEPDEREYLERQVRRRRVARSMLERCRIVLRCADRPPAKAPAAHPGRPELPAA